MERIDDSPVLRRVLLAGAVGTLGALLCYLGLFGFAGAAVNLALGVVLAGVTRAVAALMRGSAQRSYALLSRVAAALSNVALVYFAVGFVVFLQGMQAPPLGRLDEQDLDFLALAQEGENSKSYSARYKIELPGAYDTARIAFGSLESARDDHRVTELELEPLGDGRRGIELVEPGPDHRAALVYKRIQGAVDVAVMVRAELAAETPPEVIHVSVAADYGKQDLAWHVIRHFRQRYGDSGST